MWLQSQRRPVVDFESGEFPLTCMDLVSGNRNHVIVGNTRGVMSQHDLRMAGRLVSLTSAVVVSLVCSVVAIRFPISVPQNCQKHNIGPRM